jgi:hypothetical protein
MPSNVTLQNITKQALILYTCISEVTDLNPSVVISAETEVFQRNGNVS